MLANNLPKNAKIVFSILNKLSESERDLLIWRFVEGKSMKWVAKQMKKKYKKQITDSRVKQIEDKLIREIELAFDLYL